MLAAAKPACAEWTIGGFIGRAWTRPGTVDLSLPSEQTELALVDVAYRDQSFESPLYYGYRLSWISGTRSWFAIEGEFVHAKVFAQTEQVRRVRGTLGGSPIDTDLQLSTIVQRLAMSHGLNFLFANVALRRELGSVSGHRRATAIVRAGMGPTFPHAESTIHEVSREQYERGGVAAQVGGSLEVPVWRGLRWVGDYKFTWTTAHIDVAGGEAAIPARSHHLVSGLMYRF
jgi:hypothetical protein